MLASCRGLKAESSSGRGYLFLMVMYFYLLQARQDQMDQLGKGVCKVLMVSKGERESQVVQE